MRDRRNQIPPLVGMAKVADDLENERRSDWLHLPGDQDEETMKKSIDLSLAVQKAISNNQSMLDEFSNSPHSEVREKLRSCIVITYVAIDLLYERAFEVARIIKECDEIPVDDPAESTIVSDQSHTEVVSSGNDDLDAALVEMREINRKLSEHLQEMNEKNWQLKWTLVDLREYVAETNFALLHESLIGVLSAKQENLGCERVLFEKLGAAIELMVAGGILPAPVEHANTIFGVISAIRTLLRKMKFVVTVGANEFFQFTDDYWLALFKWSIIAKAVYLDSKKISATESPEICFEKARQEIESRIAKKCLEYSV